MFSGEILLGSIRPGAKEFRAPESGDFNAHTFHEVDPSFHEGNWLPMLRDDVR
jgi:hypothetical protein